MKALHVDAPASGAPPVGAARPPALLLSALSPLGARRPWLAPLRGDSAGGSFALAPPSSLSAAAPPSRRHSSAPAVRPFFAGAHVRPSAARELSASSLDLDQLRRLAGYSPSPRAAAGADGGASPLPPLLRQSSAPQRVRRHSGLRFGAPPGCGAEASGPGQPHGAGGAIGGAAAPDAADPPSGVDVSWHVRRCPLFAGCAEWELLAVLKASRVLSAPRYQVLFREGAPAEGGALVLVAAGSIRLRGFDEREALVRPADGALEGPACASGRAPAPPEWRADLAGAALGIEAAASDAAASGRRRADTATVAEPALLILVDPSAMPHAAREHARALANARLLTPVGRSHPIFGGLRPLQLRAVSRLFAFVAVPAGAQLLRQGEAANSFFELVAGELELSVDLDEAAEGLGAEQAAGAEPPPPARAGGGTGGVTSELLTGTSETRTFGDGAFTSWAQSGGRLGLHRCYASALAVRPCWCARAARRALAPAPVRPSLHSATHALSFCPAPSRPPTRAPSPNPAPRLRLLELRGPQFGELSELLPSIAACFRAAKELQQRLHALQRERIGAEGVRRMLAEHRTRVDERAHAMQGSRRYRLSRSGAGLHGKPLTADTVA